MSFGITVNEVQRSLNGANDFTSQIIPYDMYMPYPANTLPAVPPLQPQILGGFGDVPNDFEAGYDLQYTPVREGWYYGSQLGGALGHMNNYSAQDTEQLKRLVKFQRRQTFLQMISAMSVATVALITAYKFIKGRDHL